MLKNLIAVSKTIVLFFVFSKIQNKWFVPCDQLFLKTINNLPKSKLLLHEPC